MRIADLALAGQEHEDVAQRILARGFVGGADDGIEDAHALLLHL